ncbi:GHMP kinase [Salsipaludibacter albus]|uniref:GHMP family kinase ATP-binding protein n=1 Tax=Salsipaludibacter albus TaxID=2849650 RepID=UPI001EE3B8AA|nr:GHMP kinase [Salsipaludibacter albus]MBY5162541.1 GHMP kinase [Salsipaludibacter albus]
MTAAPATPHVVHARAPLRISFAGGGTDVPPYPQQAGGAVLSATIDWAAYASVRRGDDGAVHLSSPDLSTAAAISGRQQLARVVLDDLGGPDGAEVVLSCDAPPGSGLGSSSSLIVAMAAALADLQGTPLGPYELADRAVRLERRDLGVPGGLQDQYAATFGGFNFIEFTGDGVLVHPLRLRSDVLAELHGSLVLVPAPVTSRRSSGILTRQIEATRSREADTMARLDRLKGLAIELRTKLLRGDLTGFADVLHENWQAKRQLAQGITNDEIDDLYATARDLGALGGKLLGAGGGGYLLLMVPFERRGGFIRELRDRGAPPVSFSFTDGGVRTWRARS